MSFKKYQKSNSKTQSTENLSCWFKLATKNSYLAKKMFIGSLFLIILGAFSNFGCSRVEETKQTEKNTTQTSELKSQSNPEKEPVQLPHDQQVFIETIQSFYGPYRLAPNELKKTTLRSERKKAIKDLLLQPTGSNVSGFERTLRSIDGWQGKIIKMTTEDQKAHITIQLLGSNIKLKTRDNSSINNIYVNSDLYNKISNIAEGSTVQFSGKFEVMWISPDGQIYNCNLDYICGTWEFSSGTTEEKNSMLEPDFYIVLTDVTLPQVTQEPSDRSDLNVVEQQTDTTLTTESAKTVNSQTEQNNSFLAKSPIVQAKDGYANLRSQPSTEVTVLSQIPNGTTVSILDQQTNSAKQLWYKVEVNGQVGWIYSELLSKHP